MHYISERLLIVLRNRISKYVTNPNKRILDRIEDPDLASQVVFEELSSDKPSMICRFGATEFHNLQIYLSVHSGEKNLWDFLSGKQESWWWRRDWMKNLQNLSGFFPVDVVRIERFCAEMLDQIKDIDVLASWIDDEYIVEDKLKNAKKIFLPYLEPYWSSKPWSRILENKNVLVIHPFADQIQRQYLKNREFLFVNKSVLPLFNLITLQAVQSLGGENNGFSTWFDALDYMKRRIDEIDYDICLIGCGAYGMPLAHYVKNQGKKAVHFGGALQMLFGIKGNRWENPNYGVKEWNLPYGYYTNMINEYWTKPDNVGKPSNASSVEGACYW